MLDRRCSATDAFKRRELRLAKFLVAEAAENSSQITNI
jgi:hypothetical protein